MKTAETKLAASLALNELYKAREAGELLTGTGVYPKLDFANLEDTVPNLPALLRPQAE